MAGEEAVRRPGLPPRAGQRADAAAADGRPRSGARPHVRRDRDGGPQPAQVAGDGRRSNAAGRRPRACGSSSGPSRDRWRAPSRASSTASTRRWPGLPALAGLPAGALAAPLAAAATAVDDGACTISIRCSRRGIAAAARPRPRRRARRPRSLVKRPVRERGGARRRRLPAGDQGVAVRRRLVRASGLEVDVLADRESAAPGETARVTVNVYVPDGVARSTIESIALRAPDGLERRDPRRAEKPPGQREPARALLPRNADPRRARSASPSPPDAPFSQPYWLRTPRQGDVFDWSQTAA